MLVFVNTGNRSLAMSKVNVDFQSLAMGERGTMIYIVQKMLNSLGYGLKEDGVFSPEMQEAVKAFQESREGLVVDGVVDYITMKELDNLTPSGEL
ncbi:MAG TPA: peptidoglycan-binding protein [Campylobacterales bacterium]|nr:peptidoglycan-binding protein [Campylobacterales bacterium]HHS93610.1 peptidoglycan-binding protein [Campylobacterales bacterium]